MARRSDARPRARGSTPGSRRTWRRRADGRRHPVDDFLFTYYSHRPAALRRWHPGYGRRRSPARAGVRRAGASTRSRRRRRRPRRRASSLAARGDCWCAFIRDLLAAHRGPARAARAASGCTSGRWSTGRRRSEVRHAAWPLRLGADGHRRGRGAAPDRAARTSTRSGSSPTPARPLNTLAAHAASDRPAFEQPGCLHAGMDLYKHAYRLTPLACPATWSLTASSWPATSGSWTCARRRTTCASSGSTRCGSRPRGQAGVRRRAARLRAAGAALRARLVRGVRRPAQRRSSTLARPAHACSSVNPSSTCCSGPHPRLAGVRAHHGVLPLVRRPRACPAGRTCRCRRTRSAARRAGRPGSRSPAPSRGPRSSGSPAGKNAISRSPERAHPPLLHRSRLR